MGQGRKQIAALERRVKEVETLQGRLAPLINRVGQQLPLIGKRVDSANQLCDTIGVDLFSCMITVDFILDELDKVNPGVKEELRQKVVDKVNAEVKRAQEEREAKIKEAKEKAEEKKDGREANVS